MPPMFERFRNFTAWMAATSAAMTLKSTDWKPEFVARGFNRGLSPRGGAALVGNRARILSRVLERHRHKQLSRVMMKHRSCRLLFS